MIKGDDDDFLLFLDTGENYSKIDSVKIVHFFNKIITSPGNFNEQPITTSFHQKDGFPMKLSIESFLVLLIKCDHNVLYEFKIPIESEIDWKIVNGLRDGAFKHGFGANAKYSDNDADTSVIYYPPNDGIGKKGERQPKEIPILITIKSHFDKVFKGAKLPSETKDINNIKLSTFEDYQLLLTLFLKQKKGFLNRMFYEVSLSVKKIGIGNGLKDFFNLQNHENKESNFNFIYDTYIKENENVYSVFPKYAHNCSYCNLELVIKLLPEQLHNLVDPKINIDTNRFFTAEFIKIQSKTWGGITHRNGAQLLCTIKNNDNDIFKFKIVNCPSIGIHQTIWSCTAGLFPCDNNGDCVIYCSPQENELSKSPITLSLYKRNKLDINYEKRCSLVDQKKIWLLRRIIMGG
jgi:hypothetical protein